jgi:hypothetical protein
MSETAKDSVLFVILDLAFTISGSSQQLTAFIQMVVNLHNYFQNVVKHQTTSVSNCSKNK